MARRGLLEVGWAPSGGRSATSRSRPATVGGPRVCVEGESEPRQDNLTTTSRVRLPRRTVTVTSSPRRYLSSTALSCYRREAHWRHRLAVAVGMWPRGEVGAGVLVLSVSYGIGGPVVTVAMLSLALNLALTGVFILIVKQLIDGVPEGSPMAVHRPAVDHLTQAPSGTVS